RFTLQYPAVAQGILVTPVAVYDVVGGRRRTHDSPCPEQLRDKYNPQRDPQLPEGYRTKLQCFLVAVKVAGSFVDTPRGRLEPHLIIDDDFIGLAHGRGVQSDLEAIAPLRYRADHTPGDTADLAQRRACAQGHTDAVTGVGRRAIESPAFLARSI